MAEINEAEVLDALRECYDPEIPVNIYELGSWARGTLMALMLLQAARLPARIAADEQRNDVIGSLLRQYLVDQFAQAAETGEGGRVIVEGAPVSMGPDTRVIDAGGYRFFAGWRPSGDPGLSFSRRRMAFFGQHSAG